MIERTGRVVEAVVKEQVDEMAVKCDCCGNVISTFPEPEIDKHLFEGLCVHVCSDSGTYKSTFRTCCKCFNKLFESTANTAKVIGEGLKDREEKKKGWFERWFKKS